MAARRRRSRKRSSLLKDLSEIVQSLFELAKLLITAVVAIVVGVIAIAVEIGKLVTYLCDKYDTQQVKKSQKPTRQFSARSSWSARMDMTESPSVNAVIDAITRPVKLWNCTEVLYSHRCPVPETNGLYGWYFRSLPDQRISVEKCVCHDRCYLLYVGIAPRNERSRNTLRERITSHYSDTNSTLRQSLGALLATQLGLRPKNTELMWDHGERLSEWMSRNAFVMWIEHPKPWDIEVCVIQTFRPPINIKHNRDHPFCPTLKAARKHHKDMARRAEKRG